MSRSVILKLAGSDLTRAGMCYEEPNRRNPGSTDNSSKILWTFGDVQFMISLELSVQQYHST